MATIAEGTSLHVDGTPCDNARRFVHAIFGHEVDAEHPVGERALVGELRARDARHHALVLEHVVEAHHAPVRRAHLRGALLGPNLQNSRAPPQTLALILACTASISS